MNQRVCVKKLDEGARLPIPGVGGKFYILFACLNNPVDIEPGEKKAISTGLAMGISEDMIGTIWPCTNLTVKQDCEAGAGLLIEDYGPEVRVVLRNFGKKSKRIVHGDPIGHLVFQKVERPEMLEIKVI